MSIEEWFLLSAYSSHAFHTHGRKMGVFSERTVMSKLREATHFSHFAVFQCVTVPFDLYANIAVSEKAKPRAPAVLVQCHSIHVVTKIRSDIKFFHD